MTEEQYDNLFPPDEQSNDECEVCGEETYWEDCDNCEDGYYDAREEDPLWYDMGELKRCGTCNGKGGWFVCHNHENHPKNEN